MYQIEYKISVVTLTNLAEKKKTCRKLSHRNDGTYEASGVGRFRQALHTC